MVVSGICPGQGPAGPALTHKEMEDFLKSAKVLNQRPASKGVTGSVRATLSDGNFTHDAHIQFVDVSKAEFRTDRGVELNFKDSYKFNIAAYRLDQFLGLNMIPPSVERKVAGKASAVTWWVDDIIMDEEHRYKKNLQAPDPETWNEQMYVVRVFDQLIYNTDRNLGNLLITKGWHLEMIDHTRAFRLQKKLNNVKNLVKCDRTIFRKLKELDRAGLQVQLRPYLTNSEIDALLARRDLIVAYFETQAKEKGEDAVFYDLYMGAAHVAAAAASSHE
jgi:hypothetical protein